MEINFHGHLKMMRTAAWMWILYLAALVAEDMVIYASKPLRPILWYYTINIIPALLFLFLSFSKWLENQAKTITLLMVMIISVVPILINHLFNLRLPPAPLANLEGMVLRQLPVLIIGLVLVAWHYSRVVMVFYSIATNLFELSVVIMLNRPEDPRLVAYYFIIIVRTVCFLVVGIFINQLVTSLRTQQESLKSANNQLTHYASTLESLTVSRERNRMSRELHDTVVHTLSGLSVQLETTRAYLDIDRKTAENLLDQSLEATRVGLQETRRALKALRASPLEDLGLSNALHQLAKNASERGRLNLDISLSEQVLILSPDVEQCLFRITQEAVENVVHHANATQLKIKLIATGKDIEYMVEDDGIGFDPNFGIPGGHFGITGMKERAQMSGGELTINCKPGAGTTIRLMIKGCIK